MQVYLKFLKLTHEVITCAFPNLCAEDIGRIIAVVYEELSHYLQYDFFRLYVELHSYISETSPK